MSSDATDQSKEDEEPFAWMRPFQSRPADFDRMAVGREQYAPSARDAMLRRMQEEEALDQEIWKLALSEAYGNLNLGWFNQMQGHSQQEIIADYFRRHPAMERFVKAHRDAGTCGQAIDDIQAEIARRRANPEADSAMSGKPKPAQPEVSAWICSYYEQAYRDGREPPKRAEDVFPACRSAIGALDSQMREAMRLVPDEHKRKRGDRDRIAAIKSGAQIG
jgi:hypothetical protein